MHLKHACIPISPQPLGRASLAKSALGSDVLHDASHRSAPVDSHLSDPHLLADGTWLVSPIGEPKVITEAGKEVEEIGRPIREREAQVLVFAMPIHERAAVGPDQTSHQRPPGT